MDSRSHASPHRLAVRVRYHECDPMGVAHHAAYPVWFEMGRTEALRQRGLRYAELEASGVLLAVVSLAVKYRRPARYDDELLLETVLKGFSRVRIEHEYSLARDGLILATGSTTLACLDGSGRARAIDGELATCLGLT